MTDQDTTHADALERLARRRARAKLGWYTHAIVYIAVNLVLMAAAAVSGRHWAVVPAFGWSVALGIHGLIVFMRTGGGGLHERLVLRERERLARTRGAW